MSPSRLPPLFLAALAAAAPAAHAAAQAPAFRFHRDHVLGTSLDLTVVGEDAAEASMALAAAEAEFARLDPLLSGWREDSELSRLNQITKLRVSPDLYAVVAAAEVWRRRTGGAFDGRLGHVEALWRTGAAPHPAELKAAVLAARAPVTLDPLSREIERPEGVAFALDGIAKGHAIDRALAAARRAAPKARGLMLDLGGDLLFWGEAPDGRAWTAGVADPLAAEDNATAARLVAVGPGAIATSGRGPRDRIVGGRQVFHLLRPADGRGARAVLSAAALASTARDADALSTALAVLRPRDGIALAERLGMDALVFDDRGRAHETEGFTRVAAPVSAAQAGGAWPAGYVVSVQYEAPKIAGTKVYPPYMAVWVTDESNRLVRALALLGDDPNYIDQNYIWWRRYGRANPDVVEAVSRPTRQPGRYTAVWDGKDFQGRAVPRGKYTVHVEAIREHGGHSYQAMPLTLGAAPVEAGAPGSDELGASRVRYGPRAAR